MCECVLVYGCSLRNEGEHCIVVMHIVTDSDRDHRVYVYVLRIYVVLYYFSSTKNIESSQVLPT